MSIIIASIIGDATRVTTAATSSSNITSINIYPLVSRLIVKPYGAPDHLVRLIINVIDTVHMLMRGKFSRSYNNRL